MTPDDVMRLKVSDVIATYKERDRLRSALEEIVKHTPPVPKLQLVSTLRSIAVEALEKARSEEPKPRQSPGGDEVWSESKPI